MPTLRSMHRGYAAAIAVLAFIGFSHSRPGAAQDQGAKPPTTPAAAATAAVIPGATVQATKAAEAGAKATPDVGAACKKAIGDLGGGQVNGLDSLPADRRTALVNDTAINDLLLCLAVAEDNPHYCDSLPEKAKESCVSYAGFMRKFKSLPAGSTPLSVVAGQMYDQCKTVAPEKACKQTHDAILAGTAEACKGFPTPPGDTTEYEKCVALATGDTSHCPKAWKDCPTLAGDLDKLRKQGLQGLAGKDGAWAGANGGKAGCAPFVAKIEGLCVEKK